MNINFKPYDTHFVNNELDNVYSTLISDEEREKNVLTHGETMYRLNLDIKVGGQAQIDKYFVNETKYAFSNPENT